MLAKRKSYKIYRKINSGSDKWGQVLENEESLFDSVTGGSTYITDSDLVESKFITKNLVYRIIIDAIVLYDKENLFITDGFKTWRVIKCVPYENFFNKTMLYVEDFYV